MRIRESVKRSSFSVPLHFGDGLTIGVKGFAAIMSELDESADPASCVGIILWQRCVKGHTRSLPTWGRRWKTPSLYGHLSMRCVLGPVYPADGTRP